jgi:pyruvate ferredoxin oxidoreductase gamma subunit
VIEVRWHARAGQGAKTASQLLAMAELHAGRFVQAFPEYGPERGGAPMRAYTRIDDRRVRRRYGVTEPDVVVVIEPSLLGEVDVAEGLKPDGLLLVNLPAGAAAPEWDGVVRTVDAGAIAKPRYVNAVMLGALSGAIGEPGLEELLASARQLFGPKLAEGVLHEVEAAVADGHAALAKEVTA